MLTRPKYIKIWQLAVCLFIATTAIFLLANFTLAADPWAGDTDGTAFAEAAGLPGAGTDLRVTIARIIRIFIGFLGILAVGLVIYGGWLWMTSGGDEQKIEQAKNILKNAVIGLIIIIFSFAIASFILNLLVGATSGGGSNGPGGQGENYGLTALGNGIIESHYPARGQREVPRNTSIIITFREAMQLDTLCLPLGATVCDNSDINKNIVRIFKQSEKAVCIAGSTPSPQCTSLVETKVYSTDGKTFVFVPVNYLGSPSEYINYTVYLGNALLRQSGEKAFPGVGGDYGWSFEVSNKIDLTPPQVKVNGVFPPPDDERDTTVPGVGQQARGTVTINSPQTYRAASVTVVKNPLTAPWSEATAAVDINCNQVGTFGIKVDDSQASIIRLTNSDGELLGQGAIDGQTVTFAFCGLRLTINSGSFYTGNLWAATISPMIAADTVTVGNITYTASRLPGGNNFVVGSDVVTALNLRVLLASNPDVVVAVPWPANDIVTITARLAGTDGNNINLSSSNATRLPVVAMARGRDKIDNVTVNDRTDQPMNSAIQINFNEAIMPLTVSGTADKVNDFIRVVNADAAARAQGDACSVDAECRSFSCVSGVCDGANEYLKGKFSVSNQYRTVEFLSDKECGYNSCGEKVYCLPANSHLKVELMAASLISCASDTDCADKSPFNICDTTRNFCRDGANKYYPQAAKDRPSIVDGIVDAAFNSLDGNRNGSAYGPATYYDENNPAAIGDGDNFRWSFFISSLLDLTPPKITATTPVINGTDVPLAEEITIRFNKVMLSSRLTTGSVIVRNGNQDIQHYLLNLRNLIDQPVGYWITSDGHVNGSGEIDYTNAYINHSTFSSASTYKAQAGSGLKDIYQNCFLPCASESGACSGVTDQLPCCCNGALGASCP